MTNQERACSAGGSLLPSCLRRRQSRDVRFRTPIAAVFLVLVSACSAASGVAQPCDGVAADGAWEQAEAPRGWSNWPTAETFFLVPEDQDAELVTLAVIDGEAPELALSHEAETGAVLSPTCVNGVQIFVSTPWKTEWGSSAVTGYVPLTDGHSAYVGVVRGDGSATGVADFLVDWVGSWAGESR